MNALSKPGWILKRRGREVAIPDEATLCTWADEGRFNPGDLIYHPLLDRWLYARDVLEIRDAVEKSAARLSEVESGSSEAKEPARLADFIIRRSEGEFRAPDVATLREWFDAGRIPPDTYIYHPVLGKWMYARDLAELTSGSATPRLNVRVLAENYRQLIVWIGVQILCFLVALVIPRPLGVLSILFTDVAIMVYAYRTAESLGSSFSAIWALAMLIPIVNLIVLFALSTDARRVCAANGIEVGFLGPRID